MRHKRDPEAKRCGGDPTVGVVVTLMERVPDALAIDAELRVGEHQLGTGVHDLGFVDPGFELPHPHLAPAPSERAVPQLGGSLEADESWARTQAPSGCCDRTTLRYKPPLRPRPSREMSENYGPQRVLAVNKTAGQRLSGQLDHPIENCRHARASGVQIPSAPLGTRTSGHCPGRSRRETQRPCGAMPGRAAARGRPDTKATERATPAISHGVRAFARARAARRRPT